MKIKCPICGAEYLQGTVKYCKTCMYSIGSDPYLTEILNHPSEDDLKIYNEAVEEYRALWRERNAEKKKVVYGVVKMVEVEGGTFMMGATPEQGNDAWDYEKPPHEVKLDSYYIGKYPVTQEEWEQIMGNNPSHFKGIVRPVESISWYDAVEFCNRLSEIEGLSPAYRINKDRIDPYNESKNDDKKWTVVCDFEAKGYRLPTEAEWEYAARGGKKCKKTKYSGSNNLKEVGWYKENSSENIQNVGTRDYNELEIHDMSGNVWEWCWDWYGPYTSMSKTNPKGAKSGSNRVLRGGGWGSDAGYCRVAYRGYFSPEYRCGTLGFRLVRTKS